MTDLVLYLDKMINATTADCVETMLESAARPR